MIALGPDVVPLPWDVPPLSSSILVVLATDAPLLPVQCKRLARRATVGLARAGGTGHAFSSDLFLAFSTIATLILAGMVRRQKMAQVKA